jgi:hypothetical protein
MNETPSTLLGRAKLLTSWPDADLGDIVGLSRPTVQAIVAGKLKENLDTAQRKRLLEVMLRFRDMVTRGVDEFELLC